jgi:hypothetical protein
MGLSSVRPLVLGPSIVPEVTDLAVAVGEPDLALLSAVAHGNGPNGFAVLVAAWEALGQLDPERGAVYFQLILSVLRKPLQEAPRGTGVPKLL